METNRTSIVQSSAVLTSGVASTGLLTPDGMLTHLESRLGSLDEQINLLIEKQKLAQAVRKVLQGVENKLAQLDNDKGGTLSRQDIAEINGLLAYLTAIDPQVGKDLTSRLNDALQAGDGADDTVSWALFGPEAGTQTVRDEIEADPNRRMFEKHTRGGSTWVEQKRVLTPRGYQWQDVTPTPHSRGGATAPANSSHDAPIDAKVSGTQVTAMQTPLENLLKDIESSAQLEMIKLQSLISARNTAISLASNLSSAVNQGSQSLADNTGR